ncbi:hypothetical protein SDC9_165962 [bioreactor metagenome]|uniref:Uncharacterized protein n=1 Tax=bioreactor metagenome TaxID=1076179 RepID=A0A645FY15_9ZZZZ
MDHAALKFIGDRGIFRQNHPHIRAELFQLLGQRAENIRQPTRLYERHALAGGKKHPDRPGRVRPLGRLLLGGPHGVDGQGFLGDRHGLRGKNHSGYRGLNGPNGRFFWHRAPFLLAALLGSISHNIYLGRLPRKPLCERRGNRPELTWKN